MTEELTVEYLDKPEEDEFGDEYNVLITGKTAHPPNSDALRDQKLAASDKLVELSLAVVNIFTEQRGGGEYAVLTARTWPEKELAETQDIVARELLWEMGVFAQEFMPRKAPGLNVAKMQEFLRSQDKIGGWDMKQTLGDFIVERIKERKKQDETELLKGK